jgi:hypothetical protein
MSNVRWNSCHGCWHFLIEIIVGIIYMGVCFPGSWSMFLAMVGNFPRGVLSGVSCCISYWGNKGVGLKRIDVEIEEMYNELLFFPLSDGCREILRLVQVLHVSTYWQIPTKTFGEFYYGNCLTQLTYTTLYMYYVQFYVWVLGPWIGTWPYRVSKT